MNSNKQDFKFSNGSMAGLCVCVRKIFLAAGGSFWTPEGGKVFPLPLKK